MKVKDEKIYNNWKEKNKDVYSSCIFRYAERWANLMEKEIKHGVKIPDIAEKLSNEADTEGITGFMYECAIKILLQCWEYGEELKKWYNN